MFDYLILNGQVIDGTGSPAYRADVGIANGRIAAIGELKTAPAGTVIDAAGKYVTPGFIDIHRHADAAVFRPGFGELELKQGLTTIVNGNCGLSVTPCRSTYQKEIRAYLTPITGTLPGDKDFSSLEAYLKAAEEEPRRINTAMLTGSGTIRACAAGFGVPKLDRAQLGMVHKLLEQELAAGALGVSLGLGYAPDCFYSTEELIEALRPLTNSGIPITVHMRQEGSGVVEALKEMITVAKALHTPVEISHLKSIGRANWRRCTPEMLRLMEQARQEGVSIACDVYPYTAGSTQLVHVLPPECQQGGLEALTRNLADASFREMLKNRMLTGSDFENISLLVGFENIVVSSVPQDGLRQYEGRSIASIADAQGKDPFTCLFDLLQAAHCDMTMIDFITDEADIDAILQDAHSCVISDSTYPTTGMLHPRVYGTFTTLLEHFVREKQVLSVEAAVQKCTGRPAAVMGLHKKGVLAPGMDADVNVFDLAWIHTNATYRQPAQVSSGMDAVLVNGKPAILDGDLTGITNGTVLRR